jgi:hypothetical protein
MELQLSGLFSGQISRRGPVTLLVLSVLEIRWLKLRETRNLNRTSE